MAYATGSVADLAALLAFIQSTLTANGWTLSGEVLHKGTCYVRVRISSARIGVLGGNGIDGGNNLTGAGPREVYLGAVGGQALTYPMTVEIHVNTSPDEVYIVGNYATSYYNWAAWGVSDVSGLTGTGNWYHATRNDYAFGDQNYYSTPDGGTIAAILPPSTGACPLFYTTGGYDNLNTSFIHGDVDSRGWHGLTNAAGFASSWTYNAPLLSLQPNTWNGETILLPYPVYVPRTSGSKVTLVADLKHIRACRIDYHEPGDIITLGADKWKLYPCYRKDATNRNGNSSGATHSGTLAYAVRYTGP